MEKFLASAVIALSLAGCGFQPLYAPSNQVSAVDQFQRIYVPIMNDRNGQEMRQALQFRLNDSGDETGKDLVLDVKAFIGGAGVSVQPDNSMTRIRITGSALWILHRANDPKTLAKGSVRAIDGFDVLNGQFFGQDLEAQAVNKRVLENMAEQITDHLALYFKSHPKII